MANNKRRKVGISGLGSVICLIWRKSDASQQRHCPGKSQNRVSAERIQAKEGKGMRLNIWYTP